MVSVLNIFMSRTTKMFKRLNVAKPTAKALRHFKVDLTLKNYVTFRGYLDSCDTVVNVPRTSSEMLPTAFENY